MGVFGRSIVHLIKSLWYRESTTSSPSFHPS
jgi:hypothetical protein